MDTFLWTQKLIVKFILKYKIVQNNTWISHESNKRGKKIESKNNTEEGEKRGKWYCSHISKKEGERKKESCLTYTTKIILLTNWILSTDKNTF